MSLLKRFIPQLIVLSIICLIAGFGYIKTELISVNAPADSLHTIIIDAGHEALENTIKTPKNHRQANVEIIPKTRLNSGFSPFLNCLISRSIINLQIQKINKM